MLKLENLYKNEDAINAALKSFKARGVRLQNDTHRLACSVLAHVCEHHDIRLINRLIEAMPEMSRKNAVKAWFENYAPVTFDAKGALYVANKPHNRLGAAMVDPFWKFKPEAEYQPIDTAKALDALVKKLRKDEKETGRNWSATITALLCVPGEETVEVLPEPVVYIPGQMAQAAEVTATIQ